MSDTDSFIDEVTEAVRRDQLIGFAKRYGWVLILAIVLVVGGAAVFEYRKAQDEAAAEANGDALMAAMRAPEAQAKIIALGETQLTGDAAPLRDLLTYGLEAQDDPRTAVEGLRAMMDDPAVPPLYRDVARLRLLQLPDNILTSDQRLDIVAPMVMPGAPFRLTALELRALIYVEQKNTDAALEDLKVLINDADVSTTRRQRATQLVIALGGNPGAL